MKRFWIQRGLKFVTFGIFFIGLTGLAVMSLWNALLPTIVNVTTITFVQAMGLVILSRLLFGGFGKKGFGNGPRAAYWKGKMAEKWPNLTPEQRANMKTKWADRQNERSNRGRYGGQWNDRPVTSRAY